MAIPMMLSAGASIGDIVSATDARAEAKGFDVDRLLRLAKQKAKDPTSLDTTPPFFWRSRISSDRLDSYFTRMHTSTLKAFARDAKVGSDTRGVSFQYSHDWSRLGLGHSLDGQFLETESEPDATGQKRANEETLVDFYTVPGLRLNSEMGTDDLISGIQTGILEDVSVGFYAGRVSCGICGGDMYSGFFGMWGKDCNHFPGREYVDPYVDEKGNAYGGKVLAFAWIHDGRLSEVSQVYDGACPGAGHLKAQLYAENTDADARVVRGLETLYRMKLPGGAIMVPVGSRGWISVVGGNDGMTEAERLAAEAAARATVADVLGATPAVPAARKPVVMDARGPEPDGDDSDDDDGTDDEERALLADLRTKYLPDRIEVPTESVRAAVEGLADALVAQLAEVKRLTPLAADGTTYRSDLIASALAEGVRADASFDQAVFRGVLEACDITQIKAMRDHWKRTADDTITAGRRTTPEGDDGPNNVVDINTGTDRRVDNVPARLTSG